MPGLSIRSKAPDFRLENQDGSVVSLKDFEGKYLVVYFHPKDNTPGCQREAESFRDMHGRYAPRVLLLWVQAGTAWRRT